MADYSVEQQNANFGLIGFILGIVSLLVIFVQISAVFEPEEKSAGTKIGEMAAEIKQSAARVLAYGHRFWRFVLHVSIRILAGDTDLWRSNSDQHDGESRQHSRIGVSRISTKAARHRGFAKTPHAPRVHHRSVIFEPSGSGLGCGLHASTVPVPPPPVEASAKSGWRPPISSR